MCNMTDCHFSYIFYMWDFSSHLYHHLQILSSIIVMPITVLNIKNSKLVNSELITFYHTIICNSDSENKNMLRFLDN